MKRGAGRITTIVFGTLLFTACYAGYRVIPLYYYHFEFQNQMFGLIRIASTHTNEELRFKLKKYLRRIDIPVDVEDVMIARDESFRRMEISVPYSESIYIDFQGESYHIHTFDFFAVAKGDY